MYGKQEASWNLEQPAFGLGKLQLLFCADLFASFKRFSHFPPSILNVDSSQMRRSVEKVLGLPLKGVIPNHADQASPEAHLKRLRELSKR